MKGQVYSSVLKIFGQKLNIHLYFAYSLSCGNHNFVNHNFIIEMYGILEQMFRHNVNFLCMPEFLL